MEFIQWLKKYNDFVFQNLSVVLFIHSSVQICIFCLSYHVLYFFYRCFCLTFRIFLAKITVRYVLLVSASIKFSISIDFELAKQFYDIPDGCIKNTNWFYWCNRREKTSFYIAKVFI